MEIGIYTFADRTTDPRTGTVVSAAQRMRDLLEEIGLSQPFSKGFCDIKARIY